MSVETDLDLTGLTEEEVESGGRVQPGWYLVNVTDCFEDFKNPGNIRLEFTVSGGPFNGAKIHESLFSPDNAADADKAQTARKRMALFGKRLGVLAPSAFGSATRIDWASAIGTQMIVEAKGRQYEKDGVKRDTVDIGFGNLYKPTDERVPAEIRKRLLGGHGDAAGAAAGTPNTPKNPAPAAAAAAPVNRVARDYSNI